MSALASSQSGEIPSKPSRATPCWREPGAWPLAPSSQISTTTPSEPRRWCVVPESANWVRTHGAIRNRSGSATTAKRDPSGARRRPASGRDQAAVTIISSTLGRRDAGGLHPRVRAAAAVRVGGRQLDRTSADHRCQPPEHGRHPVLLLVPVHAGARDVDGLGQRLQLHASTFDRDLVLDRPQREHHPRAVIPGDGRRRDPGVDVVAVRPSDPDAGGDVVAVVAMGLAEGTDGVAQVVGMDVVLDRRAQHLARGQAQGPGDGAVGPHRPQVGVHHDEQVGGVLDGQFLAPHRIGQRRRFVRHPPQGYGRPWPMTWVGGPKSRWVHLFQRFARLCVDGRRRRRRRRPGGPGMVAGTTGRLPAHRHLGARHRIAPQRHRPPGAGPPGPDPPVRRVGADHRGGATTGVDASTTGGTAPTSTCSGCSRWSSATATSSPVPCVTPCGRDSWGSATGTPIRATTASSTNAGTGPRTTG